MSLCLLAMAIPMPIETSTIKPTIPINRITSKPNVGSAGFAKSTFVSMSISVLERSLTEVNPFEEERDTDELSTLVVVLDAS